MKKSLVLIFFLLVIHLLSPFLLAEELTTPDEVHVYPRGANVTWVLKAREEMTLILPSTFRADEIRYEAKDGAVVKSIEAIYQGAGSWLPPGLTSGIEEIEELRGEMERYRAILAGMQQTIQYLNSISSMEDLEDPLAFIKSSQELRIETEERKQLLTNQLEEARRRINEIEESLKRLYAGDRSRVIRLTMKTNGLGEVEITAFTPHASWKPSYRAILNPGEENMVLETYVEVKQQTGMYWNSPISCHTATPHDRISIPVVNPLVARIVEEDPYIVGSPLMDTKRMYSMEAESMEMEQIESEIGFVFTGHGYVSTDGEGSILSVKKETIPVEIHSTLVPYQEEEAWLMVESRDPIQYIIRGAVELVVDGSLSGKGVLHHRGGGEVLTMAFGRSPLITAERIRSIYHERRTWRGRNVLQDGYQIKVFNGSTREMEIVVIDRAPIEGDSRISINRLIEPKPQEEENGILIWKFSLGGGESKTLSVEYEIEYPDRMILNLH